MKRLTLVLIMVFSLVVPVLSNSLVESQNVTVSIPGVVVEPAVIPLDAEQQITISGAGFSPNEKVTIMVMSVIKNSQHMSLNNITPQIDENLTTDDNGTFTRTFTLGRLTRAFEPGVFPLWVIVGEKEVYVPIVFQPISP